VSALIDEPLGGPTPAVTSRDAAIAVGGRLLWSGVNLEVPAGEFVAILGPNGVGKSTLVKAVLGLLPLTAGHLEVLGRRPGHASHRIGYLPQRRSFDPGLRVRGVDVVRCGLDGDRWGFPFPGAGRLSTRGRRAAARVEEVIDLVDGAAYATVLMVAHDVNPILSYLDRVVYIAAGGTVSGSPAEVITGPTLSRLYDTPIEVLQASDGRLVVVGQPEAPSHHTDRHTGLPRP
jgi:zinc/manganese transport system ATP-binding protein